MLAVVVAGLFLGFRSPVIQSAQARIAESLNWRTIQFLLENAVFLFIGLSLASVVEATADSGIGVWETVGISAAILAALIGSRVLWMCMTTILFRHGPRRLQQRGWTWPTAIGVSFAGIRGVVTLAAAFLLPEETPQRAFLQFLAFVVVAGTLVEGLALPRLVRALRLPPPNEMQEHVEKQMLLAEAQTAGLARLDAEPQDGIEAGARPAAAERDLPRRCAREPAGRRRAAHPLVQPAAPRDDRGRAGGGAQGARGGPLPGARGRQCAGVPRRGGGGAGGRPAVGHARFDTHRRDLLACCLLATALEELSVAEAHRWVASESLMTTLVRIVCRAAEKAAYATTRRRLPAPLVVEPRRVREPREVDELPELFSYYGSLGMVVSAYFPFISQAENLFGETRFRTFWDAAEPAVFGGGSIDERFLEGISKILGEYDEEPPSVPYGHFGASRSTHRTRRRE